MTNSTGSRGSARVANRMHRREGAYQHSYGAKKANGMTLSKVDSFPVHVNIKLAGGKNTNCMGIKP